MQPCRTMNKLGQLKTNQQCNVTQLMYTRRLSFGNIDIEKQLFMNIYY